MEVGAPEGGASAPGPEVMGRNGFTGEHIVSTAKAMLAQ